jgi:triosephosphate isomerase (TIM)
MSLGRVRPVDLKFVEALMTSPLLVANWKMNLPPEGVGEFVAALTRLPEGVEVAIAPPFPFLAALAGEIEQRGARIERAAQNCSDRESGAYTGEVSAAMLRQAGVSHVILGHSERRAFFGEDNRLVGKKLRRAIEEGLIPIFCVGEDEETREAGRTATLLERQIVEAAEEMENLPDVLIIAYEPVWAIGTGRNASPEMAAETHGEIRRIVSGISGETELTILYGGSVSPENAAALAAQEEIDGFLVGGASLSSIKFAAIAQAMS